MDFKPVKGKVEKPELIWIYGTDGIGKSTFAADAPKPFFLDTEDRTGHLDVDRIKPDGWLQAFEVLEWFKGQKYKTLVIDSLDWLEPMVQDFVVTRAGKKNLKDVGGYGEGYTLMLDEWRKFIAKLTEIRSAGFNIILTGHAEVKTINDPTTAPFDRYQPKLYNKASAIFREFVDCVFFANVEVIAKEKEKRGFSDNIRWLFTERRPAYDAKNSFDLPERFELKQSGPFAYYQGLKNVGATPDKVTAAIETLLKADRLTDEERAGVRGKMKNADLASLLKIKKNLEDYLA
jgi:hypothetical protein